MSYKLDDVCEDETLSEWESECFSLPNDQIEQFDWKEIDDG
jgi:hypothetical protein